MRLRDTSIRALPARDKRYVVRDADGLCLYIQPTGTKTFYYVYKVAGKIKQHRIGDYPHVSLHEARGIHRQLIAERERGDIDKPEKTFAELVAQYLKHHAKDYADGGKEIRRIMDRDVYPYIGHLDLSAIRKPQIYQITTAIANRGAPRQANITLEKISVVFRYACSIGLTESNPCYAMPKARENEPRSRVLTDDEIKTVWRNRYNSDTDRILCLILLTGCRPGEAQNIHHEDIEPNGKWWICRQQKGGRISLKRTYLTCVARSLVGAGTGMAFGGMNTQNGVAKYVKRKYNAGWTPHDIRRTVASRMAEMGVDDSLVHRVLGHAQGKISRTYNVYRYDKEIRRALVLWGREVMRVVRK